ncbi:MAG TPA: restriction endonuclease [Candidatus Paceibacterota bacterium]
MSPILVVKSTGEQEVFDPSKLIGSLRRAGATAGQAHEIASHIEKELFDGMTTNDIYRHAFDLLRSMPKAAATAAAVKYSMKRAVSELGPKGFPFEKFVAEIFKAKGYEAVTDQMVEGHCVEHEIDVVAWKGNQLAMVEAKFHNEPGLKSDIKVALYIKARFDDLKGRSFIYGGKKRKLTKCFLITNTKFTDHAIRYAECQDLALIGWNYPRKGNLEDLIEESGLHPLTALPSLSEMDKQKLLDSGLVLCRHLNVSEEELVGMGVPRDRIPAIMADIKSVCK